MSRIRRPPTGEVLELACARFEAALAEGSLDRAAHAHKLSCDRCRDLERDLERTAARIASATRPATMPPGFAAGVLARAAVLEGRLPATAAGRTRSRLRGHAPWLAGAALAAGLALAFWAGTLRGVASPETRPLPVALEAAPAPPEAAPPVPGAAAEAAAGDAPVRLVAVPRPAAPAPPAPRPVVPAAAPVPEPLVDLPAELRASIVRQIQDLPGCPDHAAAAVRVTVTAHPDGTVSDRQVLSAAGAGDAHRCVSMALDRLLLPPLAEPATVTLDVSW